MRGVPADLPLQQFVGDTCIQICLGEYQTVFSFARAGGILVEGGWKLGDSTGQLVDSGSREHRRPEIYRVQILLGESVEKFSIDPPKSFTLHFTNGHDLTVFDDSERFESFSLCGYYV